MHDMALVSSIHSHRKEDESCITGNRTSKQLYRSVWSVIMSGDCFRGNGIRQRIMIAFYGVKLAAGDSQ
jgi:hypothetical protein